MGHAINSHKAVPIAAEYLVGAMAVIVLAGWFFGAEALTGVAPGQVAMKANTAVGFLLLAAALHFASAQRNFRWQQCLSLGAVLIGGLTVVEYILGVNFRMDEALFRDPAHALYPGRMALVTALNFVLLGAAMLLPRFSWADYVKEYLALMAALFSMFAVIGYLYEVPALYGVVGPTSTGMALHTGVGGLLLALGFLFVERETGFVRVFEGPSIASMVARYMVPLAVLVPAGLGAIFIRSRWNFSHPHLVMALSVVSDIVLLVLLIWTLAFMIQRVERERALVQLQAETDRLTGIYNRRYFETSLEAEVERARRYGSPMSLLLIDVDRFKELNDRHGHLVGDRVLRRLVRECESRLRTSDVFCRYGGEEFAIIAPETTGQAGIVLARRVREGVEAMRMDFLAESITISMGVAAWEPSFATNEDFIAAADSALYLSKKAGRNREHLYMRKSADEIVS